MNRRLLTLLFISPVVLFSGAVLGQEITPTKAEDVGFSSVRLARIDDIFTTYVKENKMAGSVILVSRKGKVAYYKAFGYRDKEANAKMDVGSIFRIASQTKAIVSVGIMILQEEGKLLIQDPVSRFIPEYKETTVAVPKPSGGYEVVKAKREMTIRDLLTHTAGVGYGQGVAAEEWEKAGMQDFYFAHYDEPVGETIKRMASLPMDAHPGERYVYGYATDILGVIIERASGLPLDQFLKQRIFDPLRMNDTYFYLPHEKAARLAKVYVPKDGKPLTPAPVEGTVDSQGQYVTGPRKSFSGGAGLVSTARDYYHFLKMLASGGEFEGQRLLSSRTVHLMTIDHVHGEIGFNRAGLGFGLGFEVVIDQGMRGTYGSRGQFGWGGAYGSTYWVDPAEELIVLYFTQVRPGSIVKDQLELRTLVYQALVD
ncbi:MAG TPA: serine hydrolase domain-containing protein [Chryseolinea sp.]